MVNNKSIYYLTCLSIVTYSALNAMNVRERAKTVSDKLALCVQHGVCRKNVNILQFLDTLGYTCAVHALHKKYGHDMCMMPCGCLRVGRSAYTYWIQLLHAYALNPSPVTKLDLDNFLVLMRYFRENDAFFIGYRSGKFNENFVRDLLALPGLPDHARAHLQNVLSEVRSFNIVVSNRNKRHKHSFGPELHYFA